MSANVRLPGEPPDGLNEEGTELSLGLNSMPPASSREQLLTFLDAQVFQPTLSAQPSGYADVEDRKLLKSVQKRVHESRVRYFADYPTAVEVKTNFLGDLHSKPGQALASDMWILKLRRFEDVREAFLALCARLGV